MKTRIVYPNFWMDTKFASCSVPTKLLFCYLITNQHLGLSVYLHLNDRQIMFDTGLTPNQLETGKKELTALKWMFFWGDWIFHNHKAAYVDYQGQEKVKASKEQEERNAPQEFKEVIKGLITGYEPVLNNKQEIINKNIVAREKKLSGFEKSLFDNLPLEEMEAFALKNRIPLKAIQNMKEDFISWVKAKPDDKKRWGRDMQISVFSWVRRDIRDGKIKPELSLVEAALKEVPNAKIY